MKRYFRKSANWNDGEATEVASARSFRKVMRILVLSVGALVVLGGGLVHWRMSSSLDAKISRMRGKVARILAEATDKRFDMVKVLSRGQQTMDAWRESQKEIHYTEEQFALVEPMYVLQADKLPRWNRMLGPQPDGTTAGLSFEERIHRVYREILVEAADGGWPEPPPPSLQFFLTEGMQKLFDGAVYGIVWPVVVGIRAWRQFSSASDRSFGRKVRSAVFPREHLPFFNVVWLLGFGIAAVAFGYFLCWIGMKSDTFFFSLLGLVYFLYVVIVFACIGFTFAGVLK